MTQNAVAPRADFVLPGQWWHVRLDTDESIRNAASALAFDVFGRSDERAALRRGLVQSVTDGAAAARRVGGTDFYLALELAPGVRVPVSLTIAWPDEISVPDASEASARTLLASLPDRGDDDGAVELSTGWAVRTMRHEVSGPAESGIQERYTATHWILGTGIPTPLVMTMSVPVAELGDGLKALASAVAASVTFEGRRTFVSVGADIDMPDPRGQQADEEAE
jgi:hypothetical protein